MKQLRFLCVALVFFVILGSLAQSGQAQEPETLALAERGPYGVGMTKMIFVDESREDRKLLTYIWYPAIIPEGEKEPRLGLSDAEPDASDVPYPLILYSHYLTGSPMELPEIKMHLASHGFVVAAMHHNCDREPTCLIDRPMDVTFVLDALAGVTEGDLAGMIDADRTGLMGYLAGGPTALMAGGGRIDADYFLNWSVTRDPDQYTSLDSVDAYLGTSFSFVESWDEITAYMGRFFSLDEGELWPPITDERIRAVMPVAPVLGMLFGEHGLESITVPTLTLSSTDYSGISFVDEVPPLFAQLDTADRYLIWYAGYVGTLERSDYFKHFATAFFGLYLQGQGSYGDYLSQEFVEGLDDLSWEIYDGE